MGEAKRRGTHEERAADPKGDSWRVEYWTPERLERFKRELTKNMDQQLAAIKGQLFSPIKKKTKNRKIKTGG